MCADQGDVCQAWRSPGGTTSTCPLRIKDRSPFGPSRPATRTASRRSTSIPGKRGCAWSRPTSASNRSTSSPASSSVRATRSCTARSSPVTEGTRIRSWASRTQAFGSSASNTFATAGSLIIANASGQELVLAELDEVPRDVEQAAQAEGDVPEGGADRPALPEQEEQQNERDHPDAVRQDSQLDREPGRDDAEAIEWWDRKQVDHQGRDLEKDEKRQRRPEALVARRRAILEHEKRPAERDGKQQIAQRAAGGGKSPPPIGSDRPLVEVDGAPGKTDPADQEKNDRQRDAEQRMGVLERVQREVAGGGNRPVATEEGDECVAELVDAKRGHPAADHQQQAQRQRQPRGGARPEARAADDHGAERDGKHRAPPHGAVEGWQRPPAQPLAD